MSGNFLDKHLKIVIHPSYEWLEKARAYNISHRELEVLSLLIEGHNNKEVAALLGIQYQSVKNHWHTLSKKLKVNNYAQAFLMLMALNVMSWMCLVGNPEQRVSTREELLTTLKEVISDTDRAKKGAVNTRKFLVEHGIYDEVYKDRIEELRNAERPEGQPEKTDE